MNVFELAAKLTLDTSDFDKGLSAVGGKLKKAGKTIGIALGAASAAVTGLTKQAVTAYAEYEQLTGGTALMLGDAYDSVIERSQNAYKTVQMSQNDYLTQVNRFATGLKNSMGGSEQAAADLSHRILLAEADIVAAVGVSQETVQTAFAAVMRNNYTMLDNLGIGIRGTKQGMEDVITIVNEWNAEQGKATNYQMDNYADMQNALIDYVEMVGLAGYAQMEAENTIQGSVASMKAAWQNLLVALSAGGGFKQQMDALVESARTAFNNILPIVENFLIGFADLMKQIGPMIVEKLPEIIQEVVPSVLDAAVQIVGALIEALPGILQALVTVVGGLVDSISSYLNERWPEVGQVFDGMVSAITTALGAISTFWTDTLQPAFATMWAYIVDQFAPAVSGVWSDYISPAIQSAMSAISGFWNSNLEPAFQSIYTWLSETLGPAFDTVAAAINGDEDAMAKLNDIFKIVGPIIVGLTTAFVAYTVISKTVETITLAVHAAQLLLNAAMSANPIMLVISLLAGLAAGLIYAYNTNEDFRKAVELAWETIKTKATEIFENIQTTIKTTWENISSEATQAWEDVKQFFTETWETISEAATTAWNAITDFFSETWETISGAITEAWESITSFLSETWETISSGVTEAWEAITSFFSETWESINGALTDAWNNITSFLTDTWDSLSEGAEKLFSNIQSFMETHLTPVVDWLTTTFAPVFEKVQGAIDALGSWLSDVFTGNWESAWNGIVNGFGSIWGKITGLLSGPINAVIDMINSMIAAVEGAINSVVRGINKALSIKIPAKTFNIFGQEFGFPGWSWSANLSTVSWGRISHVGGGGKSWGGSGSRFAEGGWLTDGWGYVGEFGPELLNVHNGIATVTPTDSNPYAGLESAIERAVADRLDIIIEKISERMNVYLDSGALVGGIAGEMNDELERITAWSGGGRA